MGLRYLVAELQQQQTATDLETAQYEKEHQQEEDYWANQAIAHVQRENRRLQEERWQVREAAAEKIRETVRRAESDSEAWLAETLEADDDS